MSTTQIENVDYELIPVGEKSNEMAWNVRILTGDFIETVISYGTIKLDNEDDTLKFNFTVVEGRKKTPFKGQYHWPELTSDEPELQKKATYILASILKRAHDDGQLIGENVGKDNTRTNDSEELTDE